MKKSLLALLLALAVSLTGVLWTAVTVSRGIDDVVYTQRTVVGDPTAADGVTLQHKVQHKQFLHWDSTLSFSDGQHRSETTFTYTSDRVQESREYEPSGVMLWMDAGADFNADLPRERHRGFDRIMYDLYMDTAIGETNSITVRLADVYAYYPLVIQADFGGLHFFSDENLYIENPADNAYAAVWRHVAQGFEDFFRIPVCTEEEYGLELSKRSDGMHSSFGVTEASHEKERYVMTSYSASTEKGSWFTFTTHTTEGNLVDTSLIPGGYGIYYLPVMQKAQQAAPCDGILVEDMRCMYSMDPAVEVESLSLSADESKLIVSYVTPDRSLWVDVVDAQSGERLQTMELYQIPDDGDVWVDTMQEEGCLVYFVGGLQLIVLEETPQGVERKLCVPEDRPEGFYYGRYDCRIGWDGERLVLTGNYGDSYRDVDVAVSVYTDKGLEYAGVYACSLTGTGSYAYNNYSVDDYPKVQSMQ